MALRLKQTSLLSRLILTVAFMFIGASCNSVQQPSLFNSGWLLENVNGGKEPLPRTAISLSFRPDQIWGFAGCNGIEAQMESAFVDGHSLRLTFVSTLIGCSDGKFEIEYLGLLRQATRYKTDGKTLSLFDESGQLLLTYRRDDQYLKLLSTAPPPPRLIPCNQPGSNC